MTCIARKILAAIFLIAVLSMAAERASASDDFPNRTITLVCGHPAGSGADVIVRYLAEQLAKKVPVTVIVENKPGASGNIATEFVVRSKPDGHTILVHGPNTIANESAQPEKSAFQGSGCPDRIERPESGVHDRRRAEQSGRDPV